MKAPPESTGLIFDWRHRSITRWRLSFFVCFALIVHVLCFYLFAVRSPVPARAVPLPSVVALAETEPADGFAQAGRAFPLAVPVPAGGLELPPLDVSSRYVPSYEGYRLEMEQLPDKPSPLAWPNVTGLTQRLLPPENSR